MCVLNLRNFEWWLQLRRVILFQLCEAVEQTDWVEPKLQSFNNLFIGCLLHCVSTTCQWVCNICYAVSQTPVTECATYVTHCLINTHKHCLCATTYVTHRLCAANYVTHCLCATTYVTHCLFTATYVTHCLCAAQFDRLMMHIYRNRKKCAQLNLQPF